MLRDCIAQQIGPSLMRRPYFFGYCHPVVIDAITEPIVILYEESFAYNLYIGLAQLISLINVRYESPKLISTQQTQ
jgi:hypothetical protein